MLLLIEQTEVTEEVKENLNTSNVTVNPLFHINKIAKE